MVAYLHAGLENGVSPANRMVKGPESGRKGDLCQQHLRRLLSDVGKLRTT